MKQIENYEQFCKSIGDDKENNKYAKLSLFIQNWIIRVLDSVEEDTLDYSLKKLIEHNLDKSSYRGTMKDALSSIIDDSSLAFRRLSENMREKIIRENVLMPVYKVKEINSSGLNWLSRQTGKTIKQKVSSAGNSIMAVQRRMSFDTAENRLFIAFVKELYELLNTKLETECLKREEEVELRDDLSVFLRRTYIEEIKRWDNLPPNNTLLSDQNYKKIWRSWNELKKIDERILSNSIKLGERLATIFYVELLVYLRNILFIPQEPVEVDYDEYKIYRCDNITRCLSLSGEQIDISLDANTITIYSPRKKINICFDDINICIRINDSEKIEHEVTQGNFKTMVKLVASKMGIDTNEVKSACSHKESTKCREVIVDLFSLHPRYIADNGAYEKLSERLLQQKYHGTDIDGDERDYYIPCDDTNAIKMVSGTTETYTVPFAIDNGSMEQMKRLMHMMENYITTDEFTYYFPDAYNELQLSMVHKAARMVYRKVRNIPLSIGVAFKYQNSEAFVNSFEPGDFLLVINMIDDDITFTLVSGVYDPKIAEDISDFKSIVWERHPTSTTQFKDDVNEKITDKLLKLGCLKSEKIYKLFGIDGILDETDELSVCFENEWFQFNEESEKCIELFRLNITDAVSEFIARNRSVIGKANIHIVSVVDKLIYKGSLPFSVMDKQGVLEGCQQLKKLEHKTVRSLWHDHLPALAIKLMYGKFDLIKNARVEPRFDEKQRIPISGTFTLPKKCEEYHFKLVQDENARKMQYEAVIKSPAFPLAEDTECRLVMTYQYGAEEPYELMFIPQNSKAARFNEAKVHWTKLEHYSVSDLKSPEFPRKLSWDELASFSGRKGDIKNVYHELETQYALINNGYEKYTLSDSEIRIDRRGNRFGQFDFVTKSGQEIVVSWNESAWEKGAPKVDKLSVISFIPFEDKLKDGIPRYRIKDLKSVTTSKFGDLWFKNKKGFYQCKVWYEYNGETKILSVIENYFDTPSLFNTNVNDISFEIAFFPDGNLYAKNVHDENIPKKMRCFAQGLHAGDSPPKYFINSYYGKWTRTMFANNRSVFEEGCPVDFQKKFVDTVSNWVALYNQYEDFKDKTELFKFLSLAARDIGKEYYIIAHNHIEMYKMRIVDIPSEIGCALCDLSNDMQRHLFKSLLSEVTDNVLLIAILSKAIWHNENFLFNVDLDLLLNVYLPKAVEYIGESLKRSKGNRVLKDDLENVKYCLEFILGVLRLRDLNDETITTNYLSLNNPHMQDLYKYIEQMVDCNTKIYSFLKLDISNKGRYDKICDLLYVLLVYITGYDADGEISISLNVDE